jgi:hypothetical protein
MQLNLEQFVFWLVFYHEQMFAVKLHSGSNPRNLHMISLQTKEYQNHAFCFILLIIVMKKNAKSSSIFISIE